MKRGYFLPSGHIYKVETFVQGEPPIFELEPSGAEVIELPALFEEQNVNDIFVSDPAGSPVVTFRNYVPHSINKTTVTADGIDTAIFSGIPAGVTAILSEESRVQVDDGQLVFSVDLAGEYSIELISPTHLPTTVLITAI
jgi:hypothetical protein